MAQTKSLKKNAVLNILRSICSIIFPLITFPYASRILLPEGTGIINFANSIISYFSIIASLGIGTYAIRGAAKVRDNKTELSKFTKEIITINLISTAIAYIIFFIAITFSQKLQNQKFLLIIISSTLLLNTLGVSWLYSALEEYSYITMRTILFQLISIIALFVLVKTKDDYMKYAAIGVFSSAGSNILNIIHSAKYINLFLKIKLELKKHIKPILILFITSVAINIFTILDTSMLGFLTNTTEVGYYSAASKIVKMIRDLFPAVFTVLFARLSYYVAKNDKNSLITLSEKTLKFIFFMAPPMTVGLIVLMPTLVSLLCGIKFYPAINTARTMAPLLIISSYSGFLGGQLMIAMQKEKMYMWCMIGAAICDVVLNLIFIPKFGAFGAATATILTEICIFITYTLLLRDFLTQIKIKKHIIQCVIGTTVMGLIIVPEYSLLSNKYLELFIIPITGGFIYFIILTITKNEFLLLIRKQIFEKMNLKNNK